MPFCEYCGRELDADAAFCPNCGKPVKKAAPVASIQSTRIQTPDPITPKPEAHGEIPPFNLESILLPGEQVAWHIDFEEGVIHRHPKHTYAITNFRVLSIDRLTATLTMALQIKETEVAVLSRHEESNSFGGGMYHEGFYSGSRVGTAREIGTIVFLTDGVKKITLGGINDPEGVKNLFETIKRA